MSQEQSKTNKPKSMVLATAAVVALLVALACGIFGAITAVADVVKHEENAGYLDAKLIETWGDRPDGNIYPGYSTTRTSIVTNEGTEPCYVRIRYDKYWADKETLEKDDPEKYDASLIEIGYDDTEKWQDGGDGWFYYVDAIEPGAQTSSLFKDVTFSTKIGEEFNDGEATQNFHEEVKNEEALDSIYLTEAAIIDVELQAVTTYPEDNGSNANGADLNGGLNGNLNGLRASFIPKTGDTLSPLVLTLFVLAIIAFATCIFLFIASKRKKNQEEAQEDATMGSTPQQNLRC